MVAVVVAVAVAVEVAVVVVVGYLLVSFDVFVWVLPERGASHSSKGRGSVVIENRADQDSSFFVAQLLKDVPHLKVKHDPGFLLCHGCSSFCELIVSFGELIIVHMFVDVNRKDYFLKHKVK